MLQISRFLVPTTLCTIILLLVKLIFGLNLLLCLGLFKASLVINDITADKEIGLQCHMENSTSGVQMLSFAGFISFRAGEKVSVYVYSSSDTSWTIKSQSSISFHLFGNFGSSPGFLVTPGATRTLNNPSNQQLTSWSKSGRAGLFQSLTGKHNFTRYFFIGHVTLKTSTGCSIASKAWVL